MYREKKIKVFENIKYISPCSGFIEKIEIIDEKKIITINNQFLDLYQKVSPVNGVIEKITNYDLKNKFKSNSTEITIVNNEGESFTLLFSPGFLIKNCFHSYVSLGQRVKQGDEIAFMEFGGKTTLTIPKDLSLSIDNQTEIVCGISYLIL